MGEKKSVLETLSESQEASERSAKTGGVARVKRRVGKVKAQRWMSDEGADSLLAGLIGESEGELEAERRQRAEAKRRKEEEALAAREREADRVETERRERLRREQARRESATQRRTEMLVAIKRQRRIDAGELVEQEEARALEAERQRVEREAAERREQEAAVQHANAIIRQQQEALSTLAQRPTHLELPAQRSSAWVIGIVAALVLAVGGFVLWTVAPEHEAAQPDPYAMEQTYPTAQLAVVTPSSPLSEVGLDVVRQDAGATATTIESKKPTKRTRSRRTRTKPTTEYEGIEGSSDILQGRGPRIVH